jgi:phosphoribosyl 1,2-cyclic phosphodiesterase
VVWGDRCGKWARVMPVRFAVLASGSRGNAALVEAGGAGLLVDLGLPAPTLAQRLAKVGSAWDHLGAAILTHTHGDHVEDSTLRMMARRGIVLFCHEAHRTALADWPGFQALERLGLARRYDDRPFLTPTGHRIEPVALRHDSGPTFGFRIEGQAQRGARWAALGYLADTGCWSEVMVEAMADVDLLGVEFNHDEDLQRQSGRPPRLIRRILGNRGHLSNAQGAAFVAAVLQRSRPGAIRQIVLLHLSEECNRPELALQSARAAVRRTGRRVSIIAAQQHEPHPSVAVRPGRRGPAVVAVGLPGPWGGSEQNGRSR